MSALKGLTRVFAASLAMAAIFTGAGFAAPSDMGVVPAAEASSNGGSISLSHSIQTPEARADASNGRLLTNAEVRINAVVQIDGASSSSAVEFRLPKGLQTAEIPAHCESNSSLSHTDEPSRSAATTADTWKSFEEQILVCDLGSHSGGYTNSSVWVDARVRPELPPGHEFVVEAQAVADNTVVAGTSYDGLPAVHSEAQIAMGPHIELHPDVNWPSVNYRGSWRAQPPTAAKHPHSETEVVYYWRIRMGMVLTTPSKYGNQPLDWSKSEISFDMKPDEVFYPGVTQTKAWRDRQRSHGDAYEYYMPHLHISSVRPGAAHTLSSNGDPLESFRGASNDIKFTADPRNQKITIDATQIDTSGWTAPVRVAAGSGSPLPNHADDYDGPDYEMLWARNFEVFTPMQSIRDLMDDSNVNNRLPVTISEPTFRGVGLHEANDPWISQSRWSERGTGRAQGHIEARNYITSPRNSSPLNTPGITFSSGFSSWWEGLPGSTHAGDGNGQLMPGQTAIWTASNRITAPPGGVSAQYQCVTWEDHLSLTDPGNKYHPTSGGAQGQRYPAKGAVYMTGHTNRDVTNAYFEVQYSNASVSGNRATCDEGRWYDDPSKVPGNNSSLAKQNIYTGVKQVRFVVANDDSVRRDIMTVVPLTSTNSSYRGDAWIWNSYASMNYRTHTFDSYADANIDDFFDDPDFDRVATTNRSAVAHRAEKLRMVNPLSMVELSAQSPVRGGHLGEVTVAPHSPSTTGPMEVTVEFDPSMVYHDTKTGPSPHQINDRSVVYRVSDPSSIDEIVIEMLTTPNSRSVDGKLSAKSRLPNEESRTNNNDSATMRIHSSTPMNASLIANQDVVDVHPFTNSSQENSWRMNFRNSAPFHTADVTAYILMPRADLANNTLAHSSASLIPETPTGTGWGVRSTNQAFNRNAVPSQLAKASYQKLPSNRSNVEVIRLTKEIVPGREDSATFRMQTRATSDGDRITPHMIYNVDLKVDGDVVRSFTGTSTPDATEVSAGSAAGMAWVDGTVVDHDGKLGKNPIGVPDMPVSISGTTDTGVNISNSIYGRTATTDSDGEWSVGNLPAGDYNVEFAGQSWMDDSDFTAYTSRGGDSVVGYSGNWTSNLSNQRTTGSVTVPAVSASNRTGTAHAGVVGDSGLTMNRQTTQSHDFGYRDTGQKTVFTVRNNSDTFVENAEVVQSISGPASGASATVSGPGSASVSGSTVTYTADRLEPGQRATVTVIRTVDSGAAEGDVLLADTSSSGTFYGYDSRISEAATTTTEVAVPTLSAQLEWTDSGSWLPNIEDELDGWQTGNSAPDDAALTEDFEASSGAIDDADAESMFGPGESLTSHYTVTNDSDVVSVSVSQLLAQLTGAELDESIELSTKVLAPGESVRLNAAFVDSLAQVEVDMNEAVADLEASGVAPRFAGNYTSETQDLADEITEAFIWDSWSVPFHRYSELTLLSRATDASGDGVVEADEEGQFSYTWINQGNLTLDDVQLGDATSQSPRFEDGFDGVLSPGEQVRGRTSMTMPTSLFGDEGLFVNQAAATASAPLDTDEDPEAESSSSLAQRVASGLDLVITLVDADADGSVSLGEIFGYQLQLRNNSAERYSEIELDGPVRVSSGGVDYELDASFPADFTGVLGSGESVQLDTGYIPATDNEASPGYVDISSGEVNAQARALGMTSNGTEVESNRALDTSGVFAERLIVAAGEGAGAEAEGESSNLLYWVLSGIAGLVILGLVVLLVPFRRNTKKVTSEQRELLKV